MQTKESHFNKTILIWCYLFLATTGILIAVQRFDHIIMEHDKELTVQLDHLIAEKMNASISYMQQSVLNIANLVAQEDIAYESLYNYMQNSYSHNHYTSIGLIDPAGTIYGSLLEQEELDKVQINQLTLAPGETHFSAPYRSGATGNLVFTITAPIYYADVYKGCVFATYSINKLQEIGESSTLRDNADIYLLNRPSGNLLCCSSSDPNMPGTWMNRSILKQSISSETLPLYEEWERQMLSGNSTATVQFTIDDYSYTQVYKNLNTLEDWCVVVRIPNKSLTQALSQFRSISIILIVILLLGSIGLILFLHHMDYIENQKIMYLSNHDTLTGVLNRNCFEIYSQGYLDNDGQDIMGAIIFMDIDHFKEINDMYGHDMGDHALIVFAETLKKIFPEDSYISRYGGDEFLLLVKNLQSQEELEEYLNQLQDTLLTDSQLICDDEPVKLEFSAGITTFPSQGVQINQLVKQADTALYDMKNHGKNGFCWFTPL